MFSRYAQKVGAGKSEVFGACLVWECMVERSSLFYILVGGGLPQDLVEYHSRMYRIGSWRSC